MQLLKKYSLEEYLVTWENVLDVCVSLNFHVFVPCLIDKDLRWGDTPLKTINQQIQAFAEIQD